MSDVRRAALGEPTDETADSTLVELAGAVIEISRDDDSAMGISVERVPADLTTAALSLADFNDAAKGVRLTDENGDVTRSRVVGTDVSLPGVERVSDNTRADTRTESDDKAALETDGRPSPIERKRQWMKDNYSFGDVN